MLFTKVFHTSLFARAFHFIQSVVLALRISAGPVDFSRRKLQTTRWCSVEVLHPFYKECPTLIGTSQVETMQISMTDR